MHAQMIAIVWFIFLFDKQIRCGQLNFTSDEIQPPNFSDIVQAYIQQVPQLMKDLGFDPAALPDAKRSIEGYWFTLGSDIEFDLWNGTTCGLSNFRKIGTFSVEPQDNKTYVSGKLLFPQLKTHGTAWARTFLKDMSKTVDTTLQNVTVKVNITVSSVPPIQLIKMDSNIIGIGSMDINLNDESDSMILKYFTDVIRPRFMVMMPGIVHESSDGVSRNAMLEVNKILPDLHEKIVQDVNKNKVG